MNRKIVAILVIFILISLANQFNAFGSLAKLTVKLIQPIRVIVKQVSGILVQEKDVKESIPTQPPEQKIASTSQEDIKDPSVTDDKIDQILEKNMNNDDWEDKVETSSSPSFDDSISDLYGDFSEEYDDIDVEMPDGWDDFLLEAPEERSPTFDEKYSIYFDEDYEKSFEPFTLPEEDSLWKLFLDTDEKQSSDNEDYPSELPELRDELNYW